MINKNPKQRPTATDLLNHPFFNQLQNLKEIQMKIAMDIHKKYSNFLNGVYFLLDTVN